MTCPRCASTERELQELQSALDAAREEIQKLNEKLTDANYELKHWDNACWRCSHPDSGIPERHIHEPNGPHWHHYIDPGDGLPSPCKNSDLLEEILGNEIDRREKLLSEAKQEIERLTEAVQSHHDYGPASPGEQEAAWHAYCKRFGWNPNEHPAAKNAYCEGFCDGDSYSEGDESRAVVRSELRTQQERISQLEQTVREKDQQLAECQQQFSARVDASNDNDRRLKEKIESLESRLEQAHRLYERACKQREERGELLDQIESRNRELVEAIRDHLREGKHCVFCEHVLTGTGQDFVEHAADCILVTEKLLTPQPATEESQTKGGE